MCFTVLNSGEARDFEVGGFCKGRGSTRPGGLGDGSPPAGSRGRAPVGVWGTKKVPQKLKGFCNLCPKFVTFCYNKISFIHPVVCARIKYCAYPV